MSKQNTLIKSTAPMAILSLCGMTVMESRDSCLVLTVILASWRSSIFCCLRSLCRACHFRCLQLFLKVFSFLESHGQPFRIRIHNLLSYCWVLKAWNRQTNWGTNPANERSLSVLQYLWFAEGPQDWALCGLWRLHWGFRPPLSLGGQMYWPKQSLRFLYFPDNDFLEHNSYFRGDGNCKFGSSPSQGSLIVKVD